MHRAAALLEHTMATLRNARPELQCLTITGDLRRSCKARRRLRGRGAQSAESPVGPVENAGGLQVHSTDRRHFGTTLLFATGSAAHLDGLRALATAEGMRLEPDGLHKGRGLIAASEGEIYRALGASGGTVRDRTRLERQAAEARQQRRPARDPTLSHRRVRRHRTLETMANATRKRGFEYFGVANHSKSAHYAGGLSIEQIQEQHREADRLNKRFAKDFWILKGIESDILADGSLDYPDDVSGDSISSWPASMGDSSSEADRTAAAGDLESLYHDHRPYDGTAASAAPGYEIDIEKVLRACTKHDVVVEIYAHPWRLDLD